MFNRIGLATGPRADEIAPAVTRAQTLPSIPYWLMTDLGSMLPRRNTAVIQVMLSMKRL